MRLGRTVLRAIGAPPTHPYNPVVVATPDLLTGQTRRAVILARNSEDPQADF